MRRRLSIVNQGILAAAMAVAVIACADDPPPSPGKNSNASSFDDDELNTGDPDEFVFSVSKEKKMDEAVLAASSGAGVHLMTVYFSGGTVDGCARWDLSVQSPGIKLATGGGLSKNAQKLLAKSGKDKLAGKFVSRGAKPGVRLIVRAGQDVRFTGKQLSCDKRDTLEFDVKVVAKELSKLRQIVEGFEEDGDGQSRVQVMIGPLKGDPES